MPLHQGSFPVTFQLVERAALTCLCSKPSQETGADGQFKDLRRKRDRFAEAVPDQQFRGSAAPPSEASER